MIVAILVGGIVALLAYFAACARSKRTPDTVVCIETILLGAGVPSGIHLMYCAFYPENLVHISYEDGRRFDLATSNLAVHLGEYHAVEILVGGFIGAFVCVVALVTICKKALRKDQEMPAPDERPAAH